MDIFDLSDEDVRKYIDFADRTEMLSLRQERTAAHRGLFKPRFGTARWIPVRKRFRTVGYRCSHCGYSLPEKKYYCPSCLYELKNENTKVKNASGKADDEMNFFELMEILSDD